MRRLRRFAAPQAQPPSNRARAVPLALEEEVERQAGTGTALPPAVRRDLEHGLGTPLGAVTLHTDEGAARLARVFDARAFTVGTDVFFGNQAYDPDSASGFRLLAHEMAHVLQAPAMPAKSPLTVSEPADRDERDAELAADRATERRVNGTGLQPVVTPPPRDDDAPSETLPRDRPVAVASSDGGESATAPGAGSLAPFASLGQGASPAGQAASPPEAVPTPTTGSAGSADVADLAPELAGAPLLRARRVAQRTADNRVADESMQVLRSTIARTPAPSPTAIVHEHRQITPRHQQIHELLDRTILEQGWPATHDWAYRFINADPLRDFSYSTDLTLVRDCRDIFKGVVSQREAAVNALLGPPGIEYGDLVTAGGRFVTTAVAVTKELLANSEKQLQSEMRRYGLKAGTPWYNPFGTTYSMAGGPVQQGLRDAARKLAGQRRHTDTLSNAFFRAQRAAEEDARKWGPFIGAGEALLAAQEQARKTWVEAEEIYRKDANEAQATYPVLAAYTTMDDAAKQLDSLAAKDVAALAESLYKTIDDRLKNIEKVKSEIGGRYNPWKHSQIVALTKKQLSLSPWESRIVDDHAAKVRAGQAEDATVWAVLAIGLGLLGAIPTGGSSLLAGIAFASSAIGAAYSLSVLYEHYKDYSLAKAETGTSLDKAMAISNEEPGLLWLAIDLLDLAANAMGPAAAAFREIRGAMNAAKATKGAQELKALAMVANAKGLKPQTVSRIFTMVLEGMGAGKSTEQMVKAIKEALVAANPTPGKTALREAITGAVEILGKKKIVRYAGVNRGGAIKDMEEAIAAAYPGRYKGSALHEIALRAAKDFDETGFSAAYNFKLDVIVMRPEGELSSVLAHELSHRAQMIEKQVETMGTLRREFQAFHIEREVLIMLPDELAAASTSQWLRTADDAAIIAHIRTNKAYSAAIAAEEAANPGINAVLDAAADAKLIEEWFLKGSAAR
jgi:hypothetical protein